MLPYFPFDRDTFALSMGVRALGASPLLEVDPQRYREEVRLRAAIVDADRHTYFRAAPGTEPAQWEAVELVLTSLAQAYPEHFRLVREGRTWHWENRLLGTEEVLHFGERAPGGEGGRVPAPLEWLGRQVQEDLLLLDGTAPGSPVVAGHLCFASGWCLEEKLGRPLLEVHAPVPGYAEALGRSTDLLMQRLEAGRPVGRVNWGLAVTDALNLGPSTEASWAHLREGITPQNAGDRVFLRLERQTLARLPLSRALLFTLHIWRGPIRDEAADPHRRRRLAAVLRTTPPDTRRYKRIDGYVEPLLAYLEAGPHEGGPAEAPPHSGT